MPCPKDEASPRCAGTTETCFHDPRCSSGEDPFGGLGCNAGGVAWDCRFCGFGGFTKITCPGAEVEVSLELEGDVASFNKTAYEEKLASLVDAELGGRSGKLGFRPSRGDVVVTDVKGGSVIVTASIKTPGGDFAAALTQAFTDVSTERLSEVLDVKVQAKKWVVARMRGIRVSLNQLRSRLADLESQSTTFIALCAAGMGVSLCCLLAVCCTLARLLYTPPSSNSTQGGPKQGPGDNLTAI